jgi:hypothetical protein
LRPGRDLVIAGRYAREGDMGQDMTQREPYPGREYATHGVLVLSGPVSWMRSGGCSSQRRRMLWSSTRESRPMQRPSVVRCDVTCERPRWRSCLRERESPMPLTKPRTRGKQVVRHIARFDRETTETLYAYAAFLGESTDYVLNEVLEICWRRRRPKIESPIGRTR